MRIAFALVMSTMLLACGPGGESVDDFVGSYQTTITVAGAGSQTFTDSLAISEGSTSDLILQSQQLGALRASIIGDTSFAIDQQQITLTDELGQAFSVTIMGQGTVADGVFNANGTLSSVNGALSFTIAGSRL